MSILILGIIFVLVLLVFACLKISAPRTKEERERDDNEQMKFIREYNKRKGKV